MYVVKKNKDDKWIIIKEGNQRATKVFESKAEAVAYAEGKYKDDYKIEDEFQVIRKVHKKWPKVFWTLFIIVIIAAIAFAALYFTGIIDFSKTPEYSVTLKLDGKDYQDQEIPGEVVFVFEDGTTQAVAVDSKGVAKIESKIKPTSAYLDKDFAKYSYNSNGLSFDKNDIIISLESIKAPAEGTGDEITSAYIIDKGIYRGSIGENDTLYYEFKPTNEGSFLLESFIPTRLDNIKLEATIYLSENGVRPTDSIITVKDGGVMVDGAYSNNIKYTFDVTKDFISNNNSYIIGYKATTKDNQYPAVFDFSISQSDIIENVVLEDLQFHFMEFGNAANGDATYIKAGDNDILIDAGSKSGTVSNLIEHMDKYVTDGKLEYVITTHADTDHISGMYGTKEKGTSAKGKAIDYTGILYYYEVDTLIDFALTNKDSKEGSNLSKYYNAVSYAVENGATHYTVDDCWNEDNGAKKHYDLNSAGNISMDILYNKHYFEKSNDENDYSVVTMFNYDELHYLFTGDLELSGEKSMAEYYDGSSKEKTLPEVELFKAGHHGSPTSSNDVLLDIIKPKISVASCIAGANEYTNNNDNIFPSQAFINRIAKHTDRVYVPTMIDYNESIKANEEVFKPLNGTIIVSSNGVSTAIWASNNLTKLKDSDWFNEKVYMVDGKVSDSKKGDYYTKDTPGAVLTPRRVWPSYGI